MDSRIARTAVRGITIDGPTSRDLDDAIWLERDGQVYTLTVTIADTTAIAPGSELDLEAARRAFTRYHADGNTPMLPRELSEDELSLLPGRPRLTNTIAVRLAADDLSVLETAIFPSRLVSERRFSYAEADRCIALADPNPCAEMLSQMWELASRLLASRRAGGALALYDLTRGWRTTEDGQLVRIDLEARHRANVVIQEFMVLANAAAATWAVKRGVPLLYRNHAARPSAPERRALLDELEASLDAGDAHVLAVLWDRFVGELERARYEPECHGHFGLNLPAYAHVTSPIRRYPDLVNWRLIRFALEGREPDARLRAALDGFATHVNAVEDEIKDRRQAHFKAEANELAVARARSAGALGQLAEKEFFRVVKVCAREGKLGPGVAAELTTRLLDDRAGAREIFAVLFGAVPDGGDEHRESLERMRDRALARLAERPELAVSLFAQACDELGYGPLEFEDASGGAAHAPTFTARASVATPAGTVSSPPVRARSKRSARQGATLRLLGRVLGLDRDLVPAPSTQDAGPVPVKGENYFGALLEHCAKRGLPAPSIEFDHEGAAHAPVIRCRMTWLGRAAAAEGRTRSEAKNLCARGLLEARDSGDVPEP